MRDYLKFIFKELRPYRRIVTVCMLLAVVGAGFDLAGPVIMGRGFDLAETKSAPLLYGGAILAWLVFHVLADLIRTWVAHNGGMELGNHIATSFTSRTAARLLNKPLEFHYGQRIQKLTERIANFRWSLDNFLNAGLFDLVPSMMALTAILAYLFVIDWRIGLVTLAGLTAFTAYTAKMIGHSLQSRKNWGETNGEFMNTIWDSMRNVLLVKSTANEKIIARRVGNKRRKTVNAGLKDIRLSRRMLNVQNLIVTLSMAGILGLSTHGLAQDRLTIGQTSTLIAFAFTIFGYLRSTQWQFRSYLRSLADWQAIEEGLKTPGEDFRIGQRVELTGEVEFRDVHFRYLPEQPVIEGLSFHVTAGKSVAIVGESGEGKTTLVDLLGHYLTPQAGQILMDGHGLQEINLVSLRSQMAYVPQDLTLFHESLRDNIRFGRPEATDRQVATAARQAGLIDLIKKLPDGLDTEVGERGMKLSGGERQRVAIARAFLREPRILILDEPTSHLDSRTEAAIQITLRRLMRGRTVFIIAHRLKTVADANLILVMQKGRIAETGTHKKLAADPDSVYSKLLQAQGLL